MSTETLAARPVRGADQPFLPTCLYCGGTAYVPFCDGVTDRLQYVPGVWSFWRCGDCGSATLAPHPRAEELAGFYPPVYGFAPEASRASPAARWLARLEYRWFFGPQYAAQARRVLRGIGWRGEPGRRLLDVGCGRGLRLLAFRRHGFEVHGMDFQAEVVDYVKTALGIPAQVCPIEHLHDHFGQSTFDLITAFFVMEHLPDLQAMLQSCWKVLKPGGWFVGAVPLVDHLQVRCFGKRWVGISEAPRHLSLPSKKGLLEVCRRAGFTSLFLRPDTALACASHIGLSLFPGAATSHVYGGGARSRMGQRLLAGASTLVSIPWCLAENHLLKRPAQALVFAQKPLS